MTGRIAPLLTEPAFKYVRLLESTTTSDPATVVVVGASVLDADIDPAVVEAASNGRRRVFNACLTGSDTAMMRVWWELIGPLVAPEVVVVEAHPLMLLPSGLMPVKLERHLAELRDLVDTERGATALANVSPGGRGSADGRNRADGFLQVFGGVEFDEGARGLPEDWYDAMAIDIDAEMAVDEYFEFVRSVEAGGATAMVVVSPLLLGAAPATARGNARAQECADTFVAEATRRGIPHLDLRLVAHEKSDFADPFHLRFAAGARCSRALAAALDDLGVR